MADKQDGKTLADPAMNEWLKADSRKIIYLFQLARGLHPLDRVNWPSKYPWDVRWQDLKNAIDTGKLSARFANQANKNTIVSLADLWAFAKGQGDNWQWARDICQRWADIRGEVLSQSQSPEKSADTNTKPQRGARQRIDYEALEVALKAIAANFGGDYWIKRQSPTTLAERAVAKMKADGVGEGKVPAVDTARKHFDRLRKAGELP